MLVAAMNPCPCGYFGDSRKGCRCTENQIRTYRNKISGPLLDRIDIHVEVPGMPYEQLAGLARGESSAQVRERVVRTRERQLARFGAQRKIHCNAAMSARQVQKHCVLRSDVQEHLKSIINHLNFSARAYDRILKVSRTIADLEGSDTIEIPHIHEAVQYRTLDRNLWA